MHRKATEGDGSYRFDERADFTEATLAGANLSKAVLFQADLTDADLRNADMSGANLSRANLTGANPEAARTLQGAVLSRARGLSKAQEDACRRLGANI
jgi:uncharacterized protein YjbI with pentapeptide repeats